MNRYVYPNRIIVLRFAQICLFSSTRSMVSTTGSPDSWHCKLWNFCIHLSQLLGRRRWSDSCFFCFFSILQVPSGITVCYWSHGPVEMSWVFPWIAWVDLSTSLCDSLPEGKKIVDIMRIRNLSTSHEQFRCIGLFFRGEKPPESWRMLDAFDHAMSWRPQTSLEWWWMYPLVNCHT